MAALVAMSVDAVSIDTAHGHSANVVKAIERIKGSWPSLPVTAGNVVTEEGVEALAKAGADAVKVGVGAGSICTTRVVSGAGMPQLSAIWHTTRRAQQLGVPIIADGGITFSGDIVKAIAAGAQTVMIGSLLAGHRGVAGRDGTDGRPAVQELPRHGIDGRDDRRQCRSLRDEPIRVGQDRRRRRQPEARARRHRGSSARTPGRSATSCTNSSAALRSGMGYAGAATLDGLRHARFMRVTTAGREESHPHDITITQEAPNYQRGG